MATKVTDPALLAALNGSTAAPARAKVTDPALLAQLNGAAPSAQRGYDAALENLRLTQYPDMAPDEFKRMAAATGLGPANLGDLARNSVVLGLGDEIDSALGAMGSQIQNWMGNKNAPGFGDAFGNYQKLQDARFNLGREQQGPVGTAVEIGSGLASLGPERAALDALVNGGTQAAKATPTLLRTMAGSGAAGAGIGGVTGFTNSEGDLGNRAVGAVKGAAGGALLGTAVPVLARGVSKGFSNVADALAARDASRSLGISPEAAKFVQTRMAADGSLGPVGMQRMAAAGPEATLADAGPSARNTLDYAIQSSGNAGNLARQSIDARVGRDSGAITDVLDRTLGKPVGQDTARASIRADSSAGRSSAYKDAYAQPIDYASEDGRAIEQLLQRVPKQAIDRANALMKTKGETSSQIMAQVADDGSVTFKKMPDVRQLDYITRALNEEAQHGMGAGAMGGQTALGSALGDLSSEIRDTLRLHVPEYGDALAAGQDTIRQTQAVKQGYDLLSPSTTREDVVATAKNYTPTERAAAAQGIRSKIDDAMANVTRALTDGNMDAREALKVLRDLSSRASRDKVTSVIGQAKADELFAELDRATKSFELRASVADNSKTFQRQEMGRQVDEVTNPQGIIPTVLRGEPLNAGKRAIQIVTGMTPERALAAKDSMMTEVVKALLARGGSAVDAAQHLQALGTRQVGNSAVAQALLRTGNFSGPAAGIVGQQQAQR